MTHQAAILLYNAMMRDQFIRGWIAASGLDLPAIASESLLPKIPVPAMNKEKIAAFFHDLSRAIEGEA